MGYLDEEILEARRQLRRQEHTTLETGMYAGEELITFTCSKIFDSHVCIPLPDQFVMMPEGMKNIKYPSREAPDFVMTSLDSTVNICLNLLPVSLKEGELEALASQYKNALQSIYPSMTIKKHRLMAEGQGLETECFEYRGSHLDGQSYNRVYLIRLRKMVLHGVFNCEWKNREDWSEIMDKIFLKAREEA